MSKKYEDELIEIIKDLIAYLEWEEADGWMSGQVHSDDYNKAVKAINKHKQRNKAKVND